MGINNGTIMGRLTYDPEIKKTTNDISLGRITVAVDSRGKDAKADFIPVQLWRGTAEFVQKYFKKGDMIAVQGHISVSSYTDEKYKNEAGEPCKRQQVLLVADNVSFCGGKKDSVATTQAASANSNEFEELSDDDDLPF